MRFTHLRDPSRSATLEVKDPDGVLIVTVEPAGGGKPRRKTINKLKTAMPVENAWHSALKLLFADGFVLRGPRTEPLQWLLATHEPYPHGHPFALDPRGEQVWVADTGALRRARRGDLERHDVSIGEGVMPRDITVGVDGSVHAVLDLEDNPGVGAPPFRAPARGKTAYGLVRVGPDLELELRLSVPHADDVCGSVSVTRDGRVLGPHAEGAALYDPDGAALRVLPAHRCKYWTARAAVSPSGTWFASLDPERRLRLEGPEGARVLDVTVEQLRQLSIDDAGVSLLNGFLEGAGWGLHRVHPDGRAEHLSRELEASLTPAGDAVLEAVYGRVIERGLDGAVRRELAAPELTMSRRGRARVTPDGAWIVRTDTHVLAELDPSKI